MRHGSRRGGVWRPLILAGLALELAACGERPYGEDPEATQVPVSTEAPPPSRISELEILHEAGRDDWPVDIQLDATHAYVLGKKEVARFSKASGERQTIAPVGAPEETTPNPKRLVLGATHVYWAEITGFQWGGVRRAPLDGGEREKITDGGDAVALALTDQHVYWVHAVDRLPRTGGSVWRANLDGSEPQELVSDQVDPRGLAVQGDHLYWVNTADRWAAVMRADLDGKNPEVLADGECPLSLVADATDVYLSLNHDGFEDSEQTAIALMRVSTGGGQASPIGTDAPVTWVNALATHEDSLYFADADDRSGRVYRLDKSTGSTEVVAQDRRLAGIFQLAVDAQHIYFITNPQVGVGPSRGRVGRFRRP